MLGFSVGQTAAITGHTLAQVATLEKYVSRDELLVSAQLVNMDGTEPVNGPVDCQALFRFRFP